MSRPHLHVLPGLGQNEPYVSFCGHCAAQPEPADVDTRVCTSCHLGLIVSAPLSIVPSKGEAFLMVDGKLGICAISLKAERLLGVSEADLVNRQLESAVQLTMFEPPLWAMLRDGRAETATICAANSMSELVVTPP